MSKIHICSPDPVAHTACKKALTLYSNWVELSFEPKLRKDKQQLYGADEIENYVLKKLEKYNSEADIAIALADGIVKVRNIYYEYFVILALATESKKIFTSYTNLVMFPEVAVNHARNKEGGFKSNRVIDSCYELNIVKDPDDPYHKFCKHKTKLMLLIEGFERLFFDNQKLLEVILK